MTEEIEAAWGFGSVNDEHELGHAQTYRIGAVARLTGIPPDTLRVWERRYAVVTPIRSEAGTRLYAAGDVHRLSLIKRLVDHGDAISHVAGLGLDSLRERVRGMSGAVLEPADRRPCRVVVLGETLPALMRIRELDQSADGGSPNPVNVVGLFSDEGQFCRAAPGLSADIVVLEQPTVHEDDVRRIVNLVAAAGAGLGMLVYNFAARGVIERLEARRVIAKRAPVDAAELRRWCMSLHAAALELSPPPELLADVELGGPVPPRRFDSAALTRIAAASPTVRCECPHHLVQLVSSLAAFERYSQECEDRNDDDAALHAYLHVATAQARALLEVALARVLEAEGIEV
jgi:hypothetical protein